LIELDFVVELPGIYRPKFSNLGGVVDTYPHLSSLSLGQYAEMEFEFLVEVQLRIRLPRKMV